jgi:hypothetical protein
MLEIQAFADHMDFVESEKVGESAIFERHMASLRR